MRHQMSLANGSTAACKAATLCFVSVKNKDALGTGSAPSSLAALAIAVGFALRQPLGNAGLDAAHHGESRWYNTFRPSLK